MNELIIPDLNSNQTKISVVRTSLFKTHNLAGSTNNQCYTGHQKCCKIFELPTLLYLLISSAESSDLVVGRRRTGNHCLRVATLANAFWFFIPMPMALLADIICDLVTLRFHVKPYMVVLTLETRLWRSWFHPSPHDA